MDKARRCLLPAALLGLLLVSLSGCGEREPELGATIVTAGTVPMAGDRLVSLPRPPILVAEGTDDLAMARLNAARTDWQKLYRRTDAQLVSVDALPFLTRTEAGRAFLAAEGARALARGQPAERCPATVVSVPGEAASLDDLVGDTLSRCLAELAPAHPDCGCEVLAVNDFLTVPREEMNYASGLTARMRVPELGIDDVLVADVVEGETLIRGLRGPVARLERAPDDSVAVVMLRDGRRFAGRSLPVGYRRGRIAERIYATDPAGARMSLLVGFSPKELAEGAAAWLAWPRGG